METLLINELLQAMMKNEAPSSVILCGIVAYILYSFKGHKKEMKHMAQDVDLIKNHLGITTNVVQLPNNHESKK